MLTIEYELFRMKEVESIQDMHTRFTSIISELHSLGEIIPRNKLVRKIRSMLPSSWESKVNIITEAKDLQTLTIDELVENLKTYEMKKKKDHKRRKPKRRKNMVLKTDSNESSGEDVDMAYLTKRFQKMCGKLGDFIKDCPLLKKDQYKHNIENPIKRNLFPNKRFKRKEAANNVVKQALAAWGDSSSESREDYAQGDTSKMAVESERADYNSIFALMANSDDDEDNDEDEVNFLDVQRNLKSYSQKNLISLSNVLIDAYHSLINDRNALTTKLGEIEHERDDLVVVVVDLRETIESLKRGKYTLIERIENVEPERDDLLVVVVDLKETIKELRKKNRSINTQKGKEVASEKNLKLENELRSVKSNLCAELEKNKQLQEELGRVKSDLEKSLKSTWSSDAITALYTNNGGNRQGIGFQREKTPYNPHSKYVIVPGNWLCTHCGNTGHFKENCKAIIWSQWKNKVFTENVTAAREPGPSHKKRTMPAWTKRSLIHHFPHYKGPKLVLICVKGNKVGFLSKICIVINLVTGKVVLVGKKYKNIYVIESLQSGDLSCLRAVDANAELWDRRLGYASFSLLNKLVQKDLVRGLPKSSFKEHKVCNACVKGKHVRSSSKPKKEVSTSRPLDLSYMDLCESIRVPSRGRKRYIFVIVNDYFSLCQEYPGKDENNCGLHQIISWDRERLQTSSPKLLTHLRTFGCKCYILNNGKVQLGKFDAKSDEEIFMGYSSQKGTLISQQKYIKEVLKRIDMEASKIIYTHIATATHLDMDEPGSHIDTHDDYRANKLLMHYTLVKGRGLHLQNLSGNLVPLTQKIQNSFFHSSNQTLSSSNMSDNQETQNTPSIVPTVSSSIEAPMIEPTLPTPTSQNPNPESQPPSASSPTQSSTGSHRSRKTLTPKKLWM
ncbi:uncharacterized protein [Nicotiana tomentosiformis]|uniref:uncharacterized protein n=1 Tax=Nicotiana tomentosiformis TaxID=4098 RepID=UPI00388CB09A